jgi:hypothetical protein
VLRGVGDKHFSGGLRGLSWSVAKFESDRQTLLGAKKFQGLRFHHNKKNKHYVMQQLQENV